MITPIKRMVTFSFLNLAEDIYPSLFNNTMGMDMILCRNVLMYFAPELSKKIIHRFANALLPWGCFLVSPPEASLVDHSLFAGAELPDSIYYKKREEEVKEQGTEVRSGVALFSGVGTEAAVPAFSFKAASTVAASAKEPRRPTAQDRLPDAAGSSREPVTDRSTILLQARASANQANFTDALTWCGKAIDLDSLDLEAHYLAAEIMQAEDRLEEATASLKRVLYIDQDFALAHFALGNILLRRHMEKRAGKHFKNALELLARIPSEEPLPGAEGLTAGRLSEIVQANVQNMEIFS